MWFLVGFLFIALGLFAWVIISAIEAAEEECDADPEAYERNYPE